MKFETFKAGYWHQRYQYKSFEPVMLNDNWCWEDASINDLLERASHALGELNAFAFILPESDIDLFIKMHVIKETQASSKIEGTQTGIDEILMEEEQIRPENRDDWHEVQNFIKATHTAVNRLQELPLSNRLLKEAHATLMQGVRGEHKQPGEFRNSQNWIGGSNLYDAVFIPPHHDGVLALMGDLEKFWHNQEIIVPHLIRIAISHYQFETIHPFLDGNGRMGRLLIPLYLISSGLLAKPSLYMSDFLERNRFSYYDALTRVRMSNDITHWIQFFLNGLEQTANKGRDVFKKILELRTKMNEKIANFGKRAAVAHKAMEFLYQQPSVSATELGENLQITAPTANSIINLLIKEGILNEITGQQRGRIYSFTPYLELFFN